MKTLKQLENARYSAERRANDWYYKYETELIWHCVNLRGDMISLLDAFLDAFRKEYNLGCSVADAIEAGKLKIYEKDDDDEDFGVYNECTRRVIKRLRHIEQKINEWEEKMRCLDYLIDIVNDDGTPCAYCEAAYKELIGDLAALGISI